MTQNANSVAFKSQLKLAPTRRCLIRPQRGPTELVCPIDDERAVCGPCDWILWDSGARGEKSRNEIVARCSACRDNDSANRELGEYRVIRFEFSDIGFRFHLNEVVKPGLAHIGRVHAQGGSYILGKLVGMRFQGWEIELDLFPFSGCGEVAASSREGNDVAGHAMLPKCMRRGQSCVAAKVHFDFGGQPSQGPFLAQGPKEGGLGVLHFGSNLLHPLLVSGAGQDANARRIPLEGDRCEGVYHVNRMHSPIMRNISRMKGWVILWVALVVAFVGVSKFHGFGKVTQPPGILCPDEPLQTKTTAHPFWENGYKFQPLFDFEVKARVLSVQHYTNDREAQVIPTDLGLGWGRLSDTDAISHFTFTQNVRHLFWETDDEVVYVPLDEVKVSVANMHIIPGTDAIKADLRTVKEGEIVKFNGWLVKVTGDDGFRLVSSTTREDTGGGACEIVYVKEFAHSENP